jgi:hypothetical protein
MDRKTVLGEIKANRADRCFCGKVPYSGRLTRWVVLRHAHFGASDAASERRPPHHHNTQVTTFVVLSALTALK